MKELTVQHTDNNRRIVKNSILMAVRMVFLMIINLVTVRFVRSGLGVESYGLLNAVVGVVHLLTCLGVVLSAASQRFLSMAMGENNTKKMTEVFTSSLQISFIFSMIVVVAFETIGLWFIITQMNYPASEFHSVIWIYQLAIITLVNTIIQMPFMAAIIAHEQIHVFAAATILEAVIKLFIAFALPLITSYQLIVYVGLLLTASLLTTVIYVWYCYKHYDECKTWLPNREHIRPMLSFSAWTLFGSLAGSALIQGNMLLLNIYSGTASNAAFAVAIQIYFAIIQLGSTILVAVRSRMIQSYANKQFDYLNRLFHFSELALLGLLIVICTPLIYWMPDILHMWLGNVNEETIDFSRWMVLSAGVITLGAPITIILQATGHVKQYHLLIEPIILLSLPVSWLLLKAGYPTTYTCYAILLFSVIAHILRYERLIRYYPNISLKMSKFHE